MYVYNVTRHAKAKHANQAGSTFRAPTTVSVEPLGNGVQHSVGEVGTNPTNFNVKLEEHQALKGTIIQWSEAYKTLRDNYTQLVEAYQALQSENNQNKMLVEQWARAHHALALYKGIH